MISFMKNLTSFLFKTPQLKNKNRVRLTCHICDYRTFMNAQYGFFKTNSMKNDWKTVKCVGVTKTRVWQAKEDSQRHLKYNMTDCRRNPRLSKTEWHWKIPNSNILRIILTTWQRTASVYFIEKKETFKWSISWILNIHLF